MKRLTLIAGTMLAMATCFAGPTVTERQGSHELRKRGVSDPIGLYATHAECVTALKAVPLLDATPQEYTCKDVTHFTVTPTCADEPPPVPATITVTDTRPVKYADPANNALEPGQQLNADGSITYTFTDVGELHGNLCPGRDDRYELVELRQVRQPDTEFPNCWKLTPVVVFSCDQPPAFDTDPPTILHPLEEGALQ
jgi:hypothetical protein